jgi:aspartate carbamoyltransferase catalytic subunit
MRMLPDHAIVMHPGPVNRDVEISGALMSDERMRIDRQVENGVFVRMAALERCLRSQAGALDLSGRPARAGS